MTEFPVTPSASKWGGAFWNDLAERVGTTAIYGVITFLTLGGTDTVAWDKAWAVIVLPTILSFLKAVLVNLGGNAPTASLVGVTSNT